MEKLCWQQENLAAPHWAWHTAMAVQDYGERT